MPLTLATAKATKNMYGSKKSAAKKGAAKKPAGKKPAGKKKLPAFLQKKKGSAKK